MEAKQTQIIFISRVFIVRLLKHNKASEIKRKWIATWVSIEQHSKQAAVRTRGATPASAVAISTTNQPNNQPWNHQPTNQPSHQPGESEEPKPIQRSQNTNHKVSKHFEVLAHFWAFIISISKCNQGKYNWKLNF